MGRALGRRWPVLLVVFALALLGLAFYYPLAVVLREGVWEDGRLTFGPLRAVLADPHYLRVLGFTATQALLSTLLSLALGVPGAYLLARYSFPGRRLLRSLSIVPFVLPAITVALGFVLFFGQSGHVNRVLMNLLGLPRPPLRILYSLSGIVLAHAFYNAPIVTRLVAAGWEGIDPSAEEAAASLGVRPLRRFVGVTLPLLTPSLLGSAALVFVLTFLSFPIVLVLGGARYATIEVEIYTLMRTLLDYPAGSALILVQTFLSLGVFYLFLRAEGGLAVVVRGERDVRARPLFARDGWAGKAFLLAYVGLVAVLFCGPLLSVLVDSLRVGGRFTVASYRDLLGRGYSPFLGASPWRAVGNSLFLGAVSTAMALPLGLLIAWFGVRGRMPGRRGLEALLLAPLAVSSVAVGAAILRGLGREPLHLGGTLASIALAHAILSYPFVVRAVRPGLAGLDPAWVEAARSLGASRGRAFRDIEFPLIVPSLLTAAAFAFALSVGETSATAMLARPGTETMPLAVWRLLSARQFGPASAMAGVLIGVSFLSFLAVDGLGRRGKGG